MESTQERKERIKRLRQEAEDAGQVAKDASKGQGEEDAPQPQLKLRNYEARSKKVDHQKVEPAKPPEYSQPKVEDQTVDQEDDQILTSLAPKKPTWDLKRDLEKQFQVLDQRYHKALYDLYFQEHPERRAK